MVALFPVVPFELRSRRLRVCLLASSLLLLSDLHGLANGFRLADQDAFATARGEAFVATADNPSAVYYNPAGLAFLDGLQMRGGLYTIDLDTTYQPLSSASNKGHTYNIEDHLAAAPQLFSTYSLQEPRLAFGFGCYVPYGGSIRWPDDTGFRTLGTKASIKYYRINPVIAYEVVPGLSLGAGAMVDYTEMDMEQGLQASPLPINYFRFKANGWAPAYNVGVLWHATPHFSFGLTFRSSSSFHLQGQTEFDQQPHTAASQRYASTDIDFPLTTVAGISYRPTPKWNIEFDADYTHWRTFDSLKIHQASPPYPFKEDNALNLDWQPSWMYELGATRYFEHGWHASAGYVFNQSSVPNDFYSPLAADLDRHFFSVGAGRDWDHLSVDVAYQFGYGPARTVTGSQPSSLSGVFSGQRADGTYEFMSHAIMLTVGWRF